jgi:hypothetical protein
VANYDPDRIVVFAGPSLYGHRLVPPFVAHPPAAAGDLLRLLAEPPCTVVLIDGVFDERPAVWHKEILALLSGGFRVLGAASMGALRAAELAPFGMIGIGHIFAAYAAGRISGDDEVALAHGLQEHGFKPVSVPQVNVRATLAQACRRKALPVEAARAIRALSAAIPFRDRIWPTIVAAARAAVLDATAAAADPIDLKAHDAVAALEHACETCADAPTPHPPPPATPFLRAAAQAVGVELPGSAESG